MRQPLRLLLTGYGLAALAAGTASATGAGLMLTVLLFWIGGAVAVLVIATLASARPSPAASEADEDALLAEALAAWEHDRLSDCEGASAAQQRGRSAG